MSSGGKAFERKLAYSVLVIIMALNNFISLSKSNALECKGCNLKFKIAIHI